MEKLEIKKKIWDKCVELQRKNLRLAKEAMDNAQNSANEEESASEEKFESFRAQLQSDRDLFARQYNEHDIAMTYLLSIPTDKVNTFVCPGAVVVTEKFKYYIAISLGEVKTEDTSFFVISINSPLYRILHGKKVGETFQFRDQKVSIKDIY